MAERQFVAFRLGRHVYGIDILLVREIVRGTSYTPVAGVPPAVCGLMNLRGQIVTVIDPRVAMGDTVQEQDRPDHCLVLKTAAEIQPLLEAGVLADRPCSDALGLLVDGIADVVTGDSDRIDPPPAGGEGQGPDCVSGVLKLEDNLLPLLSIQTLLARVRDHAPVTGG